MARRGRGQAVGAEGGSGVGAGADAGAVHARAVATGRRLLDQLRPDARAWSVNGRDALFTAAFDLDAEVGGFLTATLEDATVLLLQVHDARLVEREAAMVDMASAMLAEAGIDDGGVVASAKVGLHMRFVEGDARVLGRIVDGRLDTSPIGPFALGLLSVATPAQVALVAVPDSGANAVLTVGRLTQADVPAALRATGFSRHSFLVGQSGSGKTYSMGVLLEQLLLETSLPMVIVDPNSDHVHLGRLRTVDELQRGRATPLGRTALAELRRRHRAAGRVVVAGRGPTADVALQIHLSDLTIGEQALTLGLDPVLEAEEYGAFVDATRALAPATYSMRDVDTVVRGCADEANRRLALRIANLGVADWSVWAEPSAPSLAGATGLDWRVLVLDVGSLDDARERALVSLALLGAVRRREQRRSVLIVMDEAHNVCPPDAATSLGRAVTEHAVWIAAEGRKFGLHLLLATQRPQKIHPNVLSQCDNLLLMRVNSVGDLDALAAVFSHVPSTMVHESSSFGLGEMLVAGPVAPTPLRVRMGTRLTPEGGADLPTDWARRR